MKFSPGTVKNIALLMIVGTLSSACSGQKTPEPRESDQALRKELNALGDILRIIQSLSVVDDTSYEKMMRGAIDGALKTLDPHSSYISEKEFKDMNETRSGQFGGLGMEVGSERGLVKVIAPIDDTPAARAGVQAGDFIAKIDDKPITGMSLNAVVEKLRGEPGTRVKLTIMRPGVQDPIDLTLTRAVIKTNPVKHAVLDGNIGYIRLSTFMSDNADKKIAAAVDDIRKRTQDNVKGYILDLRNNPGGQLPQAQKVSDLFLDNTKPIFSTKSRIPGESYTEKATPGDITNGKPLVVLTNKGSASASEIVAGALQDHGRAIVLGQQSFGKGSVQTVIPLSHILNDASRGDAIKVTTSLYFTPSGRSIQGRGITPNILFKSNTEDQGLGVTEAELEGTIENPNGKDGQNAAPPPVKISETCEANPAKADAAKLPNAFEEAALGRDSQILCAVEYLLGVTNRTVRAPYVERVPEAPSVN